MGGEEKFRHPGGARILGADSSDGVAFRPLGRTGLYSNISREVFPGSGQVPSGTTDNREARPADAPLGAAGKSAQPAPGAAGETRSESKRKRTAQWKRKGSRKKNLKERELPSSLSGFRGRKGSRSRAALKGALIRDLKKIPDSPERNWVLKNMFLCGTARKPEKQKEGEAPKPQGVQAKRSGTPEQEGRGYASGVIRCNKNWCPICALRLAVRRREKLAARAKEIEVERTGDGWREWPLVAKERKRLVRVKAKAILRDIKKATGAPIKDLEPLLLDHLLEYLEVEEEKPELLHLVGALTCRHHLGNNPREKLDPLSELWDAFGKLDGVAERLAGYFMGAECPYGNNGWHPHLQGGWSLAYRKGEDPVQVFNAFKARVETYFREHAPKKGITVDWEKDWLQIANGSIEQTIYYVAKTLEDGTEVQEKIIEEKLDATGPVPDAVMNEAAMGAFKRSSVDMWDAPIEAFVQLAESTKGLRWFRTGGIWSSPETDKSDEELGAEDEKQEDEVIVTMQPRPWNCLSQEVRHLLLALVEDTRYSRDQVRSVWEATEAMMLDGHMDQRTIRDTLLSMIGPPDTRGAEGPRKGPSEAPGKVA